MYRIEIIYNYINAIICTFLVINNINILIISIEKGPSMKKKKDKDGSLSMSTSIIDQSANILESPS